MIEFSRMTEDVLARSIDASRFTWNNNAFLGDGFLLFIHDVDDHVLEPPSPNAAAVAA
jgi:hypothetical protein